MDAVLIQPTSLHAGFAVHFPRPQTAQTRRSSTTLTEKVQAVVQGAWYYVVLFGVSLKESKKGAVFYSFIAARMALECTFSPKLAVVTFVASLVIAWTAVAAVVFCRKVLHSSPVFRSQSVQEMVNGHLQNSRFNPEHFKAVACDLDMSQVPDTLQIHALQTLIEKVPQEMKHRRSMYGLEARNNINNLISKITTNARWSGAPSDTEERRRFYQKQISFIRIILHTLISARDAFLLEQKGVVPTKISTPAERELYKKYQNLQEDIDIFVVELARSGKSGQCAADLAGGLVDAYCRFSGKAQANQGTLQERIHYALAQERERLMRAHIQTIYGLNPNLLIANNTTHYLAAYMAELGKPLGIPGSEGVTEFLFEIDSKRMLRMFFSEYDTELALRVIREVYDNSHTARGLVHDWVKEQVGTWEQQKYDAIKETLIPVAQKIGGSPELKAEIEQQAQDVIGLFKHLYTEGGIKKNGVNYLFIKSNEEQPIMTHEKSEVLGALAVMPQVKSWIMEHVFKTTNASPIEVMKKSRTWLESIPYTEMMHLVDHILNNQTTIVTEEALKLKIEPILWLSKMNLLLKNAGIPSIVENERASFIACMQDQQKLAEVIKEKIQRTRQEEFLAALTITGDDEIERINPLVFEWLAVAPNGANVLRY